MPVAAMPAAAMPVAAMPWYSCVTLDDPSFTRDAQVLALVFSYFHCISYFQGWTSIYFK